MLVKCILKAALQSSVFFVFIVKEIAFYLFSRKCSSLKQVGFLIANPVNQFLGVPKNKCLTLKRKQGKKSQFVLINKRKSAHVAVE